VLYLRIVKKRGGSYVKFAFNEWNLGGKVIFISACLAVLAMFMPWVEISLYKNVSGLESGRHHFLILL
jgi:hypothetical protein